MYFLDERNDTQAIHTQLRATIQAIHTQLRAMIQAIHTQLLAMIQAIHTQLLATIQAVHTQLLAIFYNSLSDNQLHRTKTKQQTLCGDVIKVKDWMSHRGTCCVVRDESTETVEQSMNVCLQLLNRGHQMQRNNSTVSQRYSQQTS